MKQVRNLLIVEDDAHTREAFAEVLRCEGYDVATAANGREGLVYLRDQSAGLVFLDLKMPLIDGLTFLEFLRGDRRLADIPVVVVTAIQGELLVPGVVVIRKPCAILRLIEIARAHCGEPLASVPARSGSWGVSWTHIGGAPAKRS